MGRLEYIPSDRSGKVVYLYGYRFSSQGDLEAIFGPVCQKTGVADYHEKTEINGSVVIQLLVSQSRKALNTYIITGSSNSPSHLDARLASLLKDQRLKFAGQDDPMDMSPDVLRRVKKDMRHGFVEFKRDLRKKYHKK